MEKQVADNLTYLNVLNDLMAENIRSYVRAAAKRKLGIAHNTLSDEALEEKFSEVYARISRRL
ncbi:MAG: hypothetical protein E7203_00500 [Selenomonas ruminantium]|jgi:hypothetical protein|uniref:Uncharacterized protein n=1 Tax=Selenomonas ruminantium TaxID=971 RepID=A0A927WKE2_SELRU|nr:hypothetical protein [Selenomonas ruminantium]MBE6083950.1 hypothetical protein [Selenomonas ruminantium]